jgi:hypothetical protein
MTDPLAHLGLRDGERFLASYRRAFESIQGAFMFDAALLFFAYGTLLAEDGVLGSVLEIGVHHGLSAIAIAALRGPDAQMVAIDTFGEARDLDASGGMRGDERTFRTNLARYYRDTAFLRVIAADSRSIAPSDLGQGFAFCHIDGGHSVEETAHDLALAADVALPGALVAIDDYFNPSFPGVSEGTIGYLTEHPGRLVPVAIGCNKVILQRGSGPSDLNARFLDRYAFIPRTHAVFARADVLVLGSGVLKYVDVERSTPARLIARDLVLRVEFKPSPSTLKAAPGEAVPLRVRVRNRSNIPLDWSHLPFGLSYQLYRPDGAVERYENPRVWFAPPLLEGEERRMTLSVVAPERSGEFVVAVDVVWEGICWLRERGSTPGRARLRVR